MKCIRQHVLVSILVVFILLLAFFILGETAVREVAQYVPPASTQTAVVSDFNSNLIAHYTFDDGIVQGVIGHAKIFNGSSDYINISSPSLLNFSNNYTVSFWIKPSAGFTGTIIRLSDTISNTQSRSKYEIRANVSSVTFITGNGSSADSDSFGVSIPTDTWTFITCVHDSGNAKSCYKNGSLVSTETNDVDTSLIVPTIGLIGTNRNSSGNNFYEGTLDDVRFYSKVLSETEILELYALGSDNMGATTSSDPPVNNDPVNEASTPPPAPNTPLTVLGNGAMCSSISQWAISWTFDKEYRCGTFANGDYWVVGPVTIVNMTPTWNGSHHGWEINPTFSSTQGFYAGNYGYTTAKRPETPFVVSQGSVVKVIGEGTTSSVIKTAAVLTVLPSEPLGGGHLYFRPPYSGNEKPLIPVSHLRTDLLPRYAPTASAPTLESVRVTFSKSLRMDHHSDFARQFRPDNAMLNYQPENTVSLNEAMLRFMLNDSVEAKLPALIQFTQHALDRAYIIKQGYREPGTGHNPNQRVLAAWAAIMLDLEPIKAYLATAVDFHEDTHFVEGVNGPVWGGNEQSLTEQRYWNYIMGLGGNRSHRDPYKYIDGGIVGDYQFITSQSLKGQALIYLLFPQLRSTVPADKINALIKYTDRWVNVGYWTQPDPCAPYDGVVANYGRTFGPDGSGGCIKDTNLADGTGRFPVKHGTSKDGGQYKSNFVASMWNAYRKQAGNINSFSTIPDTCTSFTYSSWGVCSNDIQTRSIILATPNNCTGGAPITTQSCMVPLPATSTVVVNSSVQLPVVTPQPVTVSPVDVIPRTVPLNTPVTPTAPVTTPTPSFLSRFIPSFTSTKPTTPSSVTKPRTTTGPIVPLPELTPEETVTTTRLSFTEQVRSIFTYIFQRIQNGFLRIFGN